MVNLSELNYKKIILAILILVIAFSLLFGLLWLFFLKDNRNPLPAEPTAVIVTGGSLPVANDNNKINVIGPNGRLTGEALTADNIHKMAQRFKPEAVAHGSVTKVNNLLNENVTAISMSNNGLNFLSGVDNKFYFLDANGKKVLLSQTAFPFTDKVVWSHDGNKVVLSYPDKFNIYYDFTKNKKITLPAGAENFAFDSSSNKIAYKFVNNTSDNNWLMVSDIKNNQQIPVEHLGDNGGPVEVTWSPNNQVVALYHESTGIESEEVFFLGLKNENFRSLKVNGSNFKGLWSPRGDRMLYHILKAANNYNPVLAVADSNGDNISNHNFNLGLTTWVDKCTFAKDNKTVYCAVPVALPVGAGMYPELVNTSEDVFYKIDLDTGLSTLIAYPILSDKLDKFQVNKLFVSTDGTKLYFWDNWTKEIYSMRLK